MLSALNISASQVDPRSVLIVGGGVSGMQAALSLAALGVPVLLVEKNAHLGGQVMRLDKVYPTDHCAFCPAWSTAKACYESPLIKVVLHAELTGLSTDGEQALAEVTLRRRPSTRRPASSAVPAPKPALGRPSFAATPS